MSGFRRTNSGMSNQHLFYGVDLIVYLEGGTIAYNKEDVYAGSFNDGTEDILFWRNIFRKFKSSTKVKFKSVGSKTTIIGIATDIIDGSISSVIVAMDNEFDEVLGKQLEHDNILYTHGYSWENDVWNHDVIKAVLEEVSAVEIEDEDIKENFNKFISQIKKGVHADGYLFSKGDSFFPRKKGHLFCVNCQPTDLPEVKKEIINQLITTKGLKVPTINSFGKRKSIDPKKHCYGHLLADYCCQVVIHYLKNRLKLPSLNKDLIYRMGIKKYFESIFENSSEYVYYEGLFNKNGAQQHVSAMVP